MKRTFTVIVCLIALTITALTNNNVLGQTVGIIPSPQQVEMRSGTYIFSGEPKVENRLVASLPITTNMDQGYTLEVTPQKVILSYTTEVGQYYANLSLQQMIDYYKSGDACSLPCMLITDYPALKYRGWMDDISRGPIPNMDFLKREISTMAQYKMNFFNLYTEHVFKLDKYPDIAPTDGLTAEEIKELEAFAAQYHIEIFGNQQCLAHAEKTLRIPFYQDMADTKANVNPGAERTYDFLKYQLETVAKAYSSPFFNIDCDETEALGNGKAKEFVSQNGSASQVYADHINKVYNILKPLGKRVMMWGDIAAKDSAITAQLPKDMLMIVWSYGAADTYVQMIEPFTKQGLEFMVAPGMSMWSTVHPSYDTYTKNIANLVRDGYQKGALGMMNTAWDDSGESLFNSAWHGMVWAAEMSWKPIESTNFEMADVERVKRLETFDSLFNRKFVQPFNQRKTLRRLEFNIPETFQSNSLYGSLLNVYPSEMTVKSFVINDALQDVLTKSLVQYDFHKIEQTDPTCPQYTAPMRFVHYVYQRQKTLFERNILRYKIYEFRMGNSQFTQQEIEKGLDVLLTDLHTTKKEYMKLWDEECRPYSRDIVEKRYDQTAQDILNVSSYVFVDSKLLENDEGAEVNLHTLFGGKEIFYSIDGRKPLVGENLYTKPFVLKQSAMVRALTINDMGEEVISEQYVLLHKALGKILRLNSEYSSYRPQYEAGGSIALADGIVGGDAYADGTWQGYWGTDINVDFDFGKKTEIHFFKTRFFQDIYDWIMAPNTVEIYTSNNGHDYTFYKALKLTRADYSATSKGIYTIQADDLAIKSRYVRVIIKNAGPLPSWHQAKGQDSYIFCDEIILN